VFKKLKKNINKIQGRVLIGEARKKEASVFEQYGSEYIPSLLQAVFFVCPVSSTALLLARLTYQHTKFRTHIFKMQKICVLNFLSMFFRPLFSLLLPVACNWTSSEIRKRGIFGLFF
jgi:hypothetical protein